MKKFFGLTVASFILSLPSLAQLSKFEKTAYSPSSFQSKKFGLPIELYTRGFGAIVGVQQGRHTFFEFGGESSWRTVRLSRPHTYGVGGNMEYNFSQKVFGLKAFGWIKPGRLDFTYGANVVYYTNANGSRIGIGPVLGYKPLGFHLLAGANLLAGSGEMKQYNPFYFTIRYYAPISKTTGFRKSNK